MSYVGERVLDMAGRNVLGRQWELAAPGETLSEQAARVRRNNALNLTFPRATARALKLEKARADADME